MTANSQSPHPNLAQPQLVQPSLFIPHGGGPCFFMDDPAGVWTGMGDFLRHLLESLPARPKAILLVSAHWETDGFAFTGHASPGLIFDYYGFPPHTYELRYPAPGAPDVAARAAGLLQAAGFKATVAPEHGLDHGAFIPVMGAAPDADIPGGEMSLDRSLDPAMHQAAGRALASLRAEGVLIIGSGFMTHGLPYLNWSAGYDQAAPKWSAEFDAWAADALRTGDLDTLLRYRDTAPALRYAHPTVDHLLPMFVTLGAATQSDAPVNTEIDGFWLGLSKRSFAVA